MEPLGALCALGSGVALLAHALARLVALLPMTAVRVAACQIMDLDDSPFLMPEMVSRKTDNC